MSLSARIFTGLFLGVAVGVFVGEATAFLAPVGDGFIQLLKMAVLPYIVVSLIAGLGRLPQISIPAGRVEGCPVGLSLIGARGSDALLLDLAGALDRARAQES